MQGFSTRNSSNEYSGGNAAGIVLSAHAVGLSEQQMLTIAKKLNFSETVFIQRIDSEKRQISLKYMTPTREVDLCGHATIATLGYLHA